MKYALGRFLFGLMWFGYIVGPIISGSVYLWKAFWAMVNLVGFGWALVWTFPMPLGIAFFPFWARNSYEYSDPNIWFWYISGFAGLGLAFLSIFIMSLLDELN